MDRLSLSNISEDDFVSITNTVLKEHKHELLETLMQRLQELVGIVFSENYIKEICTIENPSAGWDSLVEQRGWYIHLARNAEEQLIFSFLRDYFNSTDYEFMHYCMFHPKAEKLLTSKKLVVEEHDWDIKDLLFYAVLPAKNIFSNRPAGEMAAALISMPLMEGVRTNIAISYNKQKCGPSITGHIPIASGQLVVLFNPNVSQQAPSAAFTEETLCIELESLQELTVSFDPMNQYGSDLGLDTQRRSSVFEQYMKSAQQNRTRPYITSGFSVPYPGDQEQKEIRDVV